MNNIGITYITTPSGRNKGCINSFTKSFIRDLYRNMNQILRFSCGVTLNKTGLKPKEKRLP